MKIHAQTAATSTEVAGHARDLPRGKPRAKPDCKERLGVREALGSGDRLRRAGTLEGNGHAEVAGGSRTCADGLALQMEHGRSTEPSPRGESGQSIGASVQMLSGTDDRQSNVADANELEPISELTGDGRGTFCVRAEEELARALGNGCFAGKAGESWWRGAPASIDTLDILGRYGGDERLIGDSDEARDFLRSVRQIRNDETRRAGMGESPL
jgi:hypothetical protein